MRARHVVPAAIAVAILLLAGAPSAGAAGAPTATPADATAMSAVTRTSGNGCGTARFDYSYYWVDAQHYYMITISDGEFSWKASSSTCGGWGQPYAPVLQYSGESNGQPFGWTTLHRAEYPDDRYFEGPSEWSYNNLRFRVCNWNTVTGYIGTCGSS